MARAVLCSEDPEGWSTSEGEEDQLAPEGYRPNQGVMMLDDDI